jgi:hypothetical protein
MHVSAPRLVVIWIVLIAAGPPVRAGAQTVDARPAPAVELTGGYSLFVDDSPIHHGVVGGAMRVHLLPRISAGPEVQYMIGPGDDRDLILTGNLTLDVLPPDRPVTPFFVVGAGLFHHSDRFGSSSEGAFTAGAGVRAWLNDRLYVAGEVRIGWELHLRSTATVGIALTKEPVARRAGLNAYGR